MVRKQLPSAKPFSGNAKEFVFLLYVVLNLTSVTCTSLWLHFCSTFNLFFYCSSSLQHSEISFNTFLFFLKGRYLYTSIRKNSCQFFEARISSRWRTKSSFLMLNTVLLPFKDQPINPLSCKNPCAPNISTHSYNESQRDALFLKFIW